MNTPITFTHNGKEYQGVLSQVMGAASSATWHLYAGNYYLGQLFYTDCWRFEGSDPEMRSLAEFFGSCVVAGLDSQ